MSSVPRQVPTHSSSPSKSSLRRTSGNSSSGHGLGPGPQLTTTTTTPTRSLLPSPHFEDDPIVASHQQRPSRPPLGLNNPEYSEHAVAESEHYGSGAAQHTDPVPVPISSPFAPFQPFFTLIEDSVTNEHHHPTVHYIFADDDSDIIAEAACRSLETLDPSQRAAPSTKASDQTPRPTRTSQSQENAHSGNAGRGDSNTRLPPRVAGVREHYIILDVQPKTQPQVHPEDATSTTLAQTLAGAPTYDVTACHSLSAEWQVLRTEISAAPTIGDGYGPLGEDDGLMLRIQGRGNTPRDAVFGVAEKEKGKEKEGNREKEKERESETMEELIDQFQRRLEDIKMVMDAGGSGSGGVTGGTITVGVEE